MKKSSTNKKTAVEIADTAEVPEGWAISRVENLFHSYSGGTPNRGISSFWGGAIPWLSSGDIKSERIGSASESITKAGLANSSAKLCPAGSVVIVVRSGILKHTLPVALLEGELAINQDIKCFDCGDDGLNAWFATALRSSANKILALNRDGTTVQSVKYETLKEFELFVPPLEEQKRILLKVEALSAEIDKSRERLANVSQMLKAFRRSVLAAACSGRLTEEWREKHTKSETASDMLARLSVEQQKPTLDVPDDLPESWAWISAGSLYEDARYGTSVKSDAKVSGGIPILRVPNIKRGVLDLVDLKYSRLSKPERETLALQQGDIIVCRTNGSLDLIGKAAIVPELPDVYGYASYLIRLRLNLHGVDPAFFHSFISSRLGRGQIEELARTTAGQFNLNLGILNGLALPLPPIKEQTEIVRRVQKLFNLADVIENRVEAATRRADKLTQAVLAKAFRGELVPTEADLARKDGREYEPALMLLRRIKAEQEKASARNGSPRAKRARA
jgi:type I restriction enzyme, S subunit